MRDNLEYSVEALLIASQVDDILQTCFSKYSLLVG